MTVQKLNKGKSLSYKIIILQLISLQFYQYLNFKHLKPK